MCRQLAARQYQVLLGSRDQAKGERAAAELAADRLKVHALQLEITNPQSIERAAALVSRDFGRLDVLVNNAATLYDTWQRAVDADLDQVRQALETNLLGAWRMTRVFLPLLRASEHPRVVNVSSQAGSLASMDDDTPAYRVSKAALNALTRMLAAELEGERILVNAICPGWVATDMGGGGGRPVSEGAASVMWGVTLPDGGPTGGFFRDGRPLPW